MGNPNRRPSGYVLSGGVPWPRFADGTEYADRLNRVRHLEAGEAGTLQWVEWCHPDGERMVKTETVKKATKTLPERRTPITGAWYAVVSWDRRDQPDSLPVRTPLESLTPEPTSL